MQDWKYCYDILTRIVSFVQRNPTLCSILFIIICGVFITLFAIGFILFAIGFILLLYTIK